MPAPVHRLKKSEIVWLSNNSCKHAHTYLDHYQCYLEELPEVKERIGFFDIESSNLVADFGIMLSYCILDGTNGEILSSVIKKADIERAKAGNEDHKVVRQCIEDLSKFDRIVTFYGKRFDIPFVRTRASICGVDFPHYGSLIHDDLYFVVRHRFRLSSNRLENACRVLLGDTNKTRVEGKYWRAAARGDKESLSYILDHNKKDVEDLQRLYDHVLEFVRRQDVSI